jgi:hypothetical protein
MVSNDTADTSVWNKTGTTWERVFSIVADIGAFTLRIAPENSAVVYLVDNGSTTFYYSDDSGNKVWTTRIANESIVDLAVESANVLYYANGFNVRKSTNAGFLWNDPAVAAFTSGNPMALRSIGTNLLIATNDAGVVAYSTNGGTSFTRLSTLTGYGTVQATAATLATNDYVYAVGSAAAGMVMRYKIGSVSPDNVWKAISVASTATEGFTGIVLKSGILYAHAQDTAGVGARLWRTLNPAEAGETSVTFSTINAGTTLALAPDFTNVNGRTSNLQLSTTTAGNAVWGIDQDLAVSEETGDSTTSTNDEVYTFTDTLSTVPTLTGPTADAIISVNPVSGNSFAATLTWNRPSLATAYTVQVALDTAFTQVIVNVPLVPVDPALSPVSYTIPTGTLNPGTVYYWRVRSTAPLVSPWAATRSFRTGSLDTPFALSQPAIGATDVGIKPILSWTAYTGAKWYEVTVSEDPSFAIPEWSHNVGAGVVPPTTVYGVVDALKYGTTYYWRVRGVTADPFVKGTTVITPAGPYQVGAFTTMAEPKAPKPEQIIVTQQAPAPPPVIVQVPVEKIVQQPIPNWMLMTIIVIGAVLVIALIVLIVRTRRVA